MLNDIEKLLTDHNFFYSHTINNEKWYNRGLYNVMYNETANHLIIYCVNDILFETNKINIDELSEKITNGIYKS